jgi:monothiol glutaredoxin
MERPLRSGVICRVGRCAGEQAASCGRGVKDVDVTQRIQEQLKSNPVVLYMKGTPDFPQCGFSASAVRTLEACGAEFAYVNIFEDPELREALKRYSNWPTYPQVYVQGELLGGSDILTEMFQKGELQQVLTEAGATVKTA